MRSVKTVKYCLLISSSIASEMVENLDFGNMDVVRSSLGGEALRIVPTEKTSNRIKAILGGRVIDAEADGEGGYLYSFTSRKGKEVKLVNEYSEDDLCNFYINSKQVLGTNKETVSGFYIPSEPIKVPAFFNKRNTSILFTLDSEIKTIVEERREVEEKVTDLYETNDATPATDNFSVYTWGVRYLIGPYKYVNGNSKDFSRKPIRESAGRTSEQGMVIKFSDRLLGVAEVEARAGEIRHSATSNFTNAGWIASPYQENTIKLLAHNESSYGPYYAAFTNCKEGHIVIVGTATINAKFLSSGIPEIDGQGIPGAVFENYGHIEVGGGEILAINDIDNITSYTRWENGREGRLSLKGGCVIGARYKPKTSATVVNHGIIDVQDRTEVEGGSIINDGVILISGRMVGNIQQTPNGKVILRRKEGGINEITEDSMSYEEESEAKDIVDKALSQNTRYFRVAAGMKGEVQGNITNNLGEKQEVYTEQGEIEGDWTNHLEEALLAQMGNSHCVLVQEEAEHEHIDFEQYNDSNDLFFVQDGAVIEVKPEEDKDISIQAHFLSEKHVISTETDRTLLPAITLNMNKEYTIDSFNHHYSGFLDIQNKAIVNIKKGAPTSGLIRVGKEASLTMSIGSINEENNPYIELDDDSTLRLTGLGEKRLIATVSGEIGSRLIIEKEEDLEKIKLENMAGMVLFESDLKE